MANWKLFWVESNGYENCFIVAENSQSAKRIERKRNGFHALDLNAFSVLEISEALEKKADKKFREWSEINAPQQASRSDLHQWPWYADQWLLHELGAKFRNQNHEEQIVLNNKIYSRKIAK